MKNHKRGLPYKMQKAHLQRSNYRCVFLLVYFCLLKITANTIIKANVMIVTPIKE